MPYYKFTITEGSASASRKAEIAEAMTRVHCEITSADPVDVNVSFTEVPPGNIYLAGKPFSGARMVGYVRRRPEEVMRRLLLGLAEAWSDATGEPYEEAFMILVDIPGHQAIENGRLMPDAEEYLAAVADS